MANEKNDALAILQKFTPDKYTLLFPSKQIIGELSATHKIIPEVFSVDSTDKRDAFPIPGKAGCFDLTKSTLLGMAHLAGIVFVPNECKVIENTSEAATYQSYAVMKKMDGQYIGASGTKRVTASEAGGSKDILSKAETGSIKRVIKQLLALKSYYTKEELAKTFVVPHIVPNTEKAMEDPVLRREMFRDAIKSQNLLYGMPTQSDKNVLQLPEPKGEIEDEVATIQTVQPETENKNLGDPMKDTPLQDVIDSFKLAKPEERLESLKKWIERKGYSPKPGLPETKDMSIDQQVQYLTHLHGMKDKEQKLNFD